MEKLGLDEGQSIFTTQAINKKYYDIKKDCMKTFNEQNNISFDFDKHMYLELIEQYYNVIEESFLTKDIATFTEKMNKIAYLALIKREY